MDHLEKARRVISLEIEELQRLHERIDSTFVAAVEMLKSTIESGSRIAIVGVGKSGNVGSKLAATLNSTGAPATVLNCQDAIHGDLGLVNSGDSVIALSYSGETAELLALLPHLKRRQAKIIAITGKPQSTLGKAADCVLDINVKREACPLNLAPTSSTTNTLVIGDALAMVLLESRGFTKEHFAELHPGGSLGRALLMRAGDIMRTGDDVVIVTADLSVTEAITRMTKARAGAVVIANKDGLLSGVFTQGDFVRAFQSGSVSIGSDPVGNFMTKDPIHVKDDRLVGEVLRTLEDSRIDDLVVVDAAGKPIGMIDTQDLTRLQVV
ncbi:MAG: KpsF/GutQ family sugar-phosphate isomerase [Verrucomicrobiales bacterium]|jgi:arabinose-5-phosphate isomerase|nr:KpsF/GutQ family sugar-phosphate isomerase [Verrucomicrobiales bacterium]